MSAEALPGPSSIESGLSPELQALPLGLARMRVNLKEGTVQTMALNPAFFKFLRPGIEEMPTTGSFAQHLYGEEDELLQTLAIDLVNKRHLKIAAMSQREERESSLPLPALYNVKGGRVIREEVLSTAAVGEDEVELLLKVDDYTSEISRTRTAIKGQMDSLTGLFNREYLIGQIEKALGSGRQFVLLFADVDYFKRVNEEHGHIAGDNLLVEIASQIKSCIRSPGAKDLPLPALIEMAVKMGIIPQENVPEVIDPEHEINSSRQRRRPGTDTDVLLHDADSSRIGGDEFMVLLPGLPMQSLSSIRERIEAAVEKIKVGEDEHIEISIDGIHSSELMKEGQKMTAAEFIEAADQAMFKRKLERHLAKLESSVEEVLREDELIGEGTMESLTGIISGLRNTVNRGLALLDGFDWLNRKEAQSIINIAITTYLHDAFFINTLFSVSSELTFNLDELLRLRRLNMRHGLFLREIGPVMGGNSALNYKISEEIRAYGEREGAWDDMSREAKLAFLLFRQGTLDSMKMKGDDFVYDVTKIAGPNDPLANRYIELFKNMET